MSADGRILKCACPTCDGDVEVRWGQAATYREPADPGEVECLGEGCEISDEDFHDLKRRAAMDEEDARENAMIWQAED